MQMLVTSWVRYVYNVGFGLVYLSLSMFLPCFKSVTDFTLIYKYIS